MRPPVRPAGALRASIALLALLALLAFACLALATAAPILAQQATPPAPDRWVTDAAGFLKPETRRALDEKLEAYERATGHQVVVWIGDTTGGAPLEEWSARTFEAWRLGRKGIDDGLALFIFASDRTIAIEVGYGLEDRVPDAIASRIIRDDLTPRLRAGERDTAVTGAVDALLSHIEGRPFEDGKKDTSPPGGAPELHISVPEMVLLGLVLIGFIILFIKNPSLALWLLFAIISKRNGRGGAGGGSGGGFRGGGGRSGGGGARGSW
jgi:uncharacterized protein